MKTALRIFGTWLLLVSVFFGLTNYLLYGSDVGRLSSLVRNWYNPCYGSETMGTHGRFQVPDLGIDVALYDSQGNAQEIVDARDSAVFMPWGTADGCITDHCAADGGFCFLKCAGQDRTKAKIVYADGSEEEYICRIVDSRCSACGQGSTTIRNSAGTDTKKLFSGGLWTYTCNADGRTSTTGVWWERIDN